MLKVRLQSYLDLSKWLTSIYGCVESAPYLPWEAKADSRCPLQDGTINPAKTSLLDRDATEIVGAYQVQRLYMPLRLHDTQLVWGSQVCYTLWKILACSWILQSSWRIRDLDMSSTLPRTSVSPSVKKRCWFLYTHIPSGTMWVMLWREVGWVWANRAWGELGGTGPA